MALADARAMGHIHGLGADPSDGTLYVATHFGVFRVKDGSSERVADRWQDTMGFAVVGPGRFLASGHPDLREDLPTSLGLIESTDGAETWRPVSLLGNADLHAIEAVEDHIYAFDSLSGELIVTTDRKRWKTIARAALVDLAADPADPDIVYGTTVRGDLLASIDRGPFTTISDVPKLTLIDWQPDGPLIGITSAGTVLTSNDGTSGWAEVGSIDGAVTALDASPGSWHVSTATGSIYRSTDNGVTWDRVHGDDG